MPSRPGAAIGRGSGSFHKAEKKPATVPATDKINTPKQPDPIPSNKNVEMAKLDPAISPGVRDVAQYVAELQSLLLKIGAMYITVGQQVEKLPEISSAVQRRDQVDKIRNQLEVFEQSREEKLDALRTSIEAHKKEFLKNANELVSNLIKKFVTHQVKMRVEEQIKKYEDPLLKQLKGNEERMLRYRSVLDNIEAKNKNSTLRPHLVNEPICPLTRPSSTLNSLPNSTASQNDPTTLRGLLTLNPAVTRVVMREHGLEESDDALEDGHLDNLNRLMSHLGIGYRLIPASPNPILTSVWDR